MNTQTTATEMPTPKKVPMPRNGVDTPKLFATIAAVADQPSLASFQFRAQSKWMGGTHCRTAITHHHH